MREVQISRRLKIREDGNLIVIKTGEIYIPVKDRDGYYKTKWYGRTILVHRLVAELFIPNPDNKPCVDHINHNRLDNSVENLRWVSVKENCNNRKTHSNKPNAAEHAKYMEDYYKRNPEKYEKMKQKQNERRKMKRKLKKENR
jgi:hypothetical protein